MPEKAPRPFEEAVVMMLDVHVNIGSTLDGLVEIEGRVMSRHSLHLLLTLICSSELRHNYDEIARAARSVEALSGLENNIRETLAHVESERKRHQAPEPL